MKRAFTAVRASVLAILGFVLAAPELSLRGQETGRPTAITHVTVIDTVTGAAETDRTVLIARDRIGMVGPAASVKIPARAQLVDGRGRFLIPGLWDMHFHWYERASLPIFVANGITGARVMNGIPLHHQWRRDIEAGTLVGPRFVIGSRIIDGPKPVFGFMTSVADPDAGRQAVIKAKQDGAEFIKIYWKLPRDAFFAIAVEAKRQRMPFVGHVPTSVTVAEASDAGQRSIEHEGLLIGFSTRERDVDDAIAEAFADTPRRQPKVADWRTFFRLVVETFGREKGVELLATLKKNGTWLDPTITVLRATVMSEQAVKQDHRLKYLPPAVRKEWMEFFADPHTAEDTALARRYYDLHLSTVRMARDAGVNLLAGTDSGYPFCFPGFGIHDELRLLVEAGLTPLEALQTATLNPARYFENEQDFGTVAAGKMADLVLLDANPLSAITNTTRIRAVVANGQLFERGDLDLMLANAEDAARK